jgi:hypothetical protein
MNRPLHMCNPNPNPNNAFTVFYAAATALEMPVWNTVVIPTLVLIHITIINCEKEMNDAKRQRQRRIFFAVHLLK